MKDNFKKLIMLGLVVALTTTVGCGSGDPSSGIAADMNSQNIQRVAGFYQLYHKLNQYKGPTSVEELKTCLKSERAAKNLEFMKVDPADIDDIFISERDGEEIKIRLGVPGSPRGCAEPLAFEAVGQDGVRLVGFVNGKIEEVEDDKLYDDMFEGRWKPSESRDEAVIPKFDGDGNPIN
ncbi:MAG: hypothetical protein AB8B55_07645 [Mariniblastus sp.]